jgi:dihydroxyacid dehydratase/phosphogluconate dehydratase
LALAFDLQRGGQYPSIRPISRKSLEKQGLNFRGSVDQIMKEVKKQGGLNSEIQSRIGHQLRAMYDDVVRQGVPDRFADLIRKLDGPEAAAEIAKKDGGE